VIQFIHTYAQFVTAWGILNSMTLYDASLISGARPNFANVNVTTGDSSLLPALQLPPSACRSRFGVVHGTPSQVASLGAGILRIDFEWAAVEPRPGQWNWSDYDSLVADAQNHNVEILAILDYGNPNYPPFRYFRPPTDLQRWLTFVANTVTRYKGSVHYWEVWNEPDNPVFWEDQNPVAYTALLIPTYQLIKSIDPQATVVLGGLAGDFIYLDGMYRAGAKNFFDVANYHTYSRPNAETAQAFRGIMAAHGDQNKPVWITETGAEGKPPTSSLAEQAQAVTDTYQAMLQTPGLAARVFWFKTKDDFVDSDGYGGYGLLFADGSRKPAAEAYAQLSSTCGGVPPSPPQPQPPSGVKIIRNNL